MDLPKSDKTVLSVNSTFREKQDYILISVELCKCIRLICKRVQRCLLSQMHV